MESSSNTLDQQDRKADPDDEQRPEVPLRRTSCQHYERAAYMTAARIGEDAGVSESTVVRFAMELGFEGYPHFQKVLQEELKVRLTSVQRMRASMQADRQ